MSWLVSFAAVVESGGFSVLSVVENGTVEVVVVDGDVLIVVAAVVVF